MAIMTNIDPNTAALQALLERVEAGDDQAPFWKVWLPENEDGPLAFVAQRAFHGSLDAAKALHEAVLPGWAVDRMGIWPGGIASVRIVGTHIGHDGDRWHNFKDGEAEGVSPIPSRAWLIAVLRALIATADTEGR